MPAEAVASAERARVLLVDDHALLRTGVANIINQEPDLRVVAEAGDGFYSVTEAGKASADLGFYEWQPPSKSAPAEAPKKIPKRTDESGSSDHGKTTGARVRSLSGHVGLKGWRVRPPASSENECSQTRSSGATTSR